MDCHFTRYYESRRGCDQAIKISITMNPLQQNNLDLTRREFFGKSATGVGTIALSNLLNDAGLAADSEKKAIGGLPGLPHFKPKAKNIIYCAF